METISKKPIPHKYSSRHGATVGDLINELKELDAGLPLCVHDYKKGENGVYESGLFVSIVKLKYPGGQDVALAAISFDNPDLNEHGEYIPF